MKQFYFYNKVGSGYTMEQMNSIREQQESLAKLHFDLGNEVKLLTFCKKLKTKHAVGVSKYPQKLIFPLKLTILFLGRSRQRQRDTVSEQYAETSAKA